MLRKNIKYRQIRPNMTDESLQKLAFDMKKENQTALSMDAEKVFKKDLSFLSYFGQVTHLSIRGFSHKQIENIQSLNNLVDLSLISVKIRDYSFLLPMKNLEILDIRLGSAKDFALLGKLENLKALCILKINSFKDVNFLSSMLNLQYISINSCKNVTAFPSLSNLDKLRRVHLETMSGLKEIDGISKARNLEELIVLKSSKLEPSSFNFFIDHVKLKKVLPGIGNLNSKKYRETCNMFLERIMDGFYGTENENFDLI